MCFICDCRPMCVSVCLFARGERQAVNMDSFEAPTPNVTGCCFALVQKARGTVPF